MRQEHDANLVASARATGEVQSAAADLAGQLREGLGGREPRFAVAFASTKQSLEGLLPKLSEELGVSVLGSSTAGEFSGESEGNGSAVAFAVSGNLEVHHGFGRGISQDPYAAVTRALSDIPKEVAGLPHRTAVLLVDGLAYCGEEVALLVTAELGGDVELVGGAAADDLAMQRTLVGSGHQVDTDAVAIAVIFSSTPLGIGVAHGHRRIPGQLRISRSEGSRVFEIDGSPAFEVWKSRTRERAWKDWGIDVEKLDSTSKVVQYFARYEAGLDSPGLSKVRVPLTVNDDGSLNFTAGMPEGTAFYLTETSPSLLVDSAREAARKARSNLRGPPAGAVVFDCAVRKMVLGDDFRTATQAIASEFADRPVVGAECYGEVAGNVAQVSGFHNSTTVVLAFPE